ncbi:NADPH-dependent F420 reductase [Nocardioides yefusunii]|uniref:NADPH-dependent F420 reductase n=1 Tax=Nocardioides yefusunii TaxID=2500546 RepID=A0ABW1QSJ8_9ACTN|nr:NAD(P)-binding domain-containing protein [Nocardioides yefusunii]
MTSIALIGPGRHGTAIAQLFASHGVDVVLHHHRRDKAEAAAAAVRLVANDADVTVADTARDAVEGQRFVFLTTLWDAPQRAVIAELGDGLVGKILVDVSNPLDVTPQGIIPRTPPQGSAGGFVASLLPAGTGHVKVFSMLPTAAIRAAADLDPIAALPFAADSDATASPARELLALTGWKPWLVGDLSVSGDLEIGGRFNRAPGHWGRAVLSAEEMAAFAGPEPTLG